MRQAATNLVCRRYVAKQSTSSLLKAPETIPQYPRSGNDREHGHTNDSYDKRLQSVMSNDFSTSLREVIGRSKSGMIDRILEARREFMETKQKSRSWMTPLKVLVLNDREQKSISPSWTAHTNSQEAGKLFDRGHISTSQYVALSYVWNQSAYEPKTDHSWLVQAKDSKKSNVCKVRDAVLDRVVRYMRKHDVRHLWVDQECIDSTNAEEHQQALQCMDLVFATSERPLAVLFVPIRTMMEFDTLKKLLEDEMLDCSGESGGHGHPTMNGNVSEDEIYRVLDLLHRLTSDPWWTRAWCFQEEYLAEKDMKLLIPHYLDPDTIEQHQVFGDLVVSGDLTISSSLFRRQTTRFLLAYVAMAKKQERLYDYGVCLQILNKVGDYALMGQYDYLLDLEARGKSMSTLVLKDLHQKNYTIPSDMLTIAANCNKYYRTMNTNLIDDSKASMSISMLAMWFANGEIFWNNGLADPQYGHKAWLDGRNIFGQLDAIAFDACPDIGEQSKLEYRRKMRLLRPRLLSKGVETYGHLFKIIQTIALDTEIVQFADPSQVLRGVADQVRELLPHLADRLEKFVKDEFSQSSAFNGWASRHAMSLSATNLVARLREKPYVACGIIANRNGLFTPGEVDAGIFAADSPTSLPQPAHVFTSWQQGSRGTPWYKNQPEEDKYVSLRVSVEDRSTSTNSPLLRTEAWIDGLCFYEGTSQQAYTFPWPEYFYSTS